MKQSGEFVNEWDNSFEVMRTVACFAVIIIHVFAGYFQLFGTIKISSWLVSNTLESFSRWPVQLFVMITGALVLNKNQPIRKSLYKALRFLLILLFWSISYLLVSQYFLHNNITTLGETIQNFLNGNIYYHLWYLYMLFGIYLALPFIKLLTYKSDKKLLKYYIIIFLVYSFIQFIHIFANTIFNLNISIKLDIPLMDWQLGCLILGYYINTITIKRKHFLLSIFIFININIANIILTYIETIKSGHWTEAYYGLALFTNIVSAICVFTMVKYIMHNYTLKSKWVQLCCFIGSISLTIYLIHPMIMIFYDIYIKKWVIKKIPLLSINYLINFLVVSIVSITLSYVLKLLMDKLRLLLLNKKENK